MLSHPESVARVLAVGVTVLIGVAVGLGTGRLIDAKADPRPPAGATKVIPNGARVRVDGAAGTVTVLEA